MSSLRSWLTSATGFLVPAAAVGTLAMATLDAAERLPAASLYGWLDEVGLALLFLAFGLAVLGLVVVPLYAPVGRVGERVGKAVLGLAAVTWRWGRRYLHELTAVAIGLAGAIAYGMSVGEPRIVLALSTILLSAYWFSRAAAARSGVTTLVLGDAEVRASAIVSGTARDEFEDPQAEGFQLAVKALPHPNWPTIPGAQWIWLRSSPTVGEAQNGATLRHRRYFILTETPSRAHLTIVADDRAQLSINGRNIGVVVLDEGPRRFEVSGFIVQGWNRLETQLENYPHGPGATPGSNPSGLSYRLDFRW